MKKKVNQNIILAFGVFMMAIAYKSVYDSVGMVTGGFSGVSIIIRNVTQMLKIKYDLEWIPREGIPIWVTTFVLNIPLFLFGLHIKGGKFVGKTFIGALLLSIFMAVLPAEQIGEADYILAAFVGGVLAGTGIGLVLKSEATTGGTDMLAMILHYKITGLTVVYIMNILDACIILCGAFIFGIRVSLCAILAVLITAVVAERIVQ